MDADYVSRFDHDKKKWVKVKRTELHEAGAIASGNLPTPLTKANSVAGTPETFSAPRYQGGGVRSVNVLRMLRFDPIEELVEQYRRLEKELLWHEQVRSCEVVPLNSEGKVRNYSADAHMRVYERMQSIASELMRYGYGRVPETLDVNLNRPAKLVVNLTKKGEVFTINDNSDSEITDVD